MNRTLIAFSAVFVWFVGVVLGQTPEIAGEQTIAMPQQVRFLSSDAQFDGSFPSVAPDGKRILFSRRSPQPGQ